MSSTPTDLLTAELRARGLDETPFLRLAARLAEGRGEGDDNRLGGRVEVPAPGDVVGLPTPEAPEHQHLRARGEEAIRRGEVGVVVLGGGMATRFGGVVKALYPVTEAHSFLDLKLGDVLALRRRLEARIPFACMTSFATDGPVRDALARYEDCETFSQYDAPRLAPDGSPFVESSGSISRYATGHGDLSFALRRHGVLARLRDAGVRTLLVSNVDNLTATLDPAVIGAHLEGGTGITVEVAPKHPGDKGGAPARVDGVVQIVESFRFPAAFDQESIPVFNTNTLILDTAAIDRDFDLTWFAVKKTVEDRVAYQLERLVGELTAFVPSRYLLVPREGLGARFQPVKEVEDLPRQAPLILDVLRARGAL